MSAAVLSGPARAEAVAALANMTISVLGGAGERRVQDHELVTGRRAALIYLLSELRRGFYQFKGGF